MPVVIALVVLVNVLRPSGDDGTPAEVLGSTPSGRADLPVLEVPAAPVEPAAEGDCEDLLAAVPFELAGEPARQVSSDSPYVYAWGDPPVVLVCGVARPDGFTVGAGLIQINGVQWFVDTTDAATTVWTAVDRPVYVEVRVPAATDSAGVTQLTLPIGETLEQRDPDPAG